MAGDERVIERIPGYCALCISRCGSIAVVEDGRFVALEPDPTHPTGQALCAKGRAAPELVYHGDRLLYPLKRTRPKGDPESLGGPGQPPQQQRPRDRHEQLDGDPKDEEVVGEHARDAGSRYHALPGLEGTECPYLDHCEPHCELGAAVLDRQGAPEPGAETAHRHDTEDVPDPITTLRTSGSAVFVCSLTTIIGYGSLLVSDNLAIKGFGTASLIGEITCVLTALVLVPALLALGGRRRCTS